MVYSEGSLVRIDSTDEEELGNVSKVAGDTHM